MPKYAKTIVDLAESKIGITEGSDAHKKIIDTYNAHKPLARGYKVKYTDDWCATYLSALAIELGYTDIIPTECGCGELMQLFEKMGCLIENENRVPNPGDFVFYDWNDGEDYAETDNKGWPRHVAIVVEVNGNKITVNEGNSGNEVVNREIEVNGQYIRAYACPKYDVEPIEKPAEKPIEKPTENEDTVTLKLPRLKRGMSGQQVKVLHTLLKSYGHDFNYVMGIYEIRKSSFGIATAQEVKNYQKKNGLTVDGVVGTQTWTSLLKLNK